MIGYIKSHWAGEQSLALSYWINGVLIGVVVLFVINTVNSTTQIFSELVPWILMVIGTVGLSVWSWVGIWRSAKHSIERSRLSVPKKSAFWAYAAMVSVIWGVLQTTAAWLPLFADLETLYGLSKSEVATQFDIQYKGETDVILTGWINGPSVEAVKNAFLEDERRNALQLFSPGGFLLPAYDLADFVEQRGLKVAAREKCESACLLVLAAAKKAWVTPDTRLVFHHPEAAADFVSEVMAIEMDREVDEYYARFRRYGVPAKLLAELRARGSAVMSIGEAYDAYIVDELWEPISNKFYDLELLCKQVDCFSTPLILP